MTSSVFNAITHANKLKKAGLADEIAYVAAEELSNFLNNLAVTKDDLTSVKNELKNDIKNVKEELKKDIELVSKDIQIVKDDLKTVKEELKKDIQIVTYKLQSFMVKCFIATLGVIEGLPMLKHYLSSKGMS